MSDNNKTQFHDAEIAIQTKLGIADMVAQYSEGFIRPAMPEQHRDFFNKLNTIIIGLVDYNGYPWALPLFGEQGFIHSPDETILTIATQPDLTGLLNLDFNVGKKIGLIGIEQHTRRRNRMNGHIKQIENGKFAVAVEQSFGNCPQYIQKRQLTWSKNQVKISDNTALNLAPKISDNSAQLLSNADTFFIASRTNLFSEDQRNGIDASHRGGKPGFVKIEDDTLYFPDFSGNRFFNTLGNIESDGRVGLYFPDFSTGDTVFLCGDATIIWDQQAALEFAGAERIISVKVKQSIFLKNYLAMTGELDEQSPSLAGTGTWRSEVKTSADQQLFNIIDKQQESRDITSFYLAPQDNSIALKDYIPGQFLPITINNSANSTTIKRSYTLSRAALKDAYRISVKREQQGLASRILHDQFNIGDSLYVGTPSGQFTIAENDHAIVLLSGGVGITPMFAMLEGLIRDAEQGLPTRKVCFIHGTHNSKSIVFLDKLTAFSVRYPWLTVHIAYSRPQPDDIKSNTDLNISLGRINIELLKSILAFDHYDFYLCGAAPFMRSLYAGIIATGVKKSNIFYEFFGEGSIEAQETSHSPVAQQAQVHFAKSNLIVEWTPDDGTLLALAEKQGVPAMSSCRVGGCGSCSCKLKSGEISYKTTPAFTPNEGDVLLCSARPSKNGDTIILDL